jgi:DNA replication protein DnaC
MSIEKIELNRIRFNTWEKPKLMSQIKKFSLRIWETINDPSSNFPSYMETIQSAYLYGPTGTGKSTLACWLALKWAEEKYVSGKANIECIIVKNEFILQQVKKCFNSTEATEFEIIEKYKKVPLLVIDEIGTMTSSNWAYSIMYMIIDYRNSMKMKTIYTSNFTIEELNGVFDSRITRRILQDCKENVIELTKVL